MSFYVGCEQWINLFYALDMNSKNIFIVYNWFGFGPNLEKNQKKLDDKIYKKKLIIKKG